MKILLIPFLVISQTVLAMGDPYFVPAVPPSSKSQPDISDLRHKNQKQQQKQEQTKHKQRKKKL